MGMFAAAGDGLGSLAKGLASSQVRWLAGALHVCLDGALAGYAVRYKHICCTAAST